MKAWNYQEHPGAAVAFQWVSCFPIFPIYFLYISYIYIYPILECLNTVLTVGVPAGYELTPLQVSDSFTLQLKATQDSHGHAHVELGS